MKERAELRKWCEALLLSWSMEIYCDLFVVSLVGPVFSLAFIELFTLLGMLKDDLPLEFSESHPCDACRLAEQKLFLVQSGWWSSIEPHNLEYLNLMKTVADLETSKYFANLTEKKLDAALVRAFLGVLPTLRVLREETFNGYDCAPDVFHAWKDDLFKLLGNGIVPSTIMKAGKPHHPPTVALLNGAGAFYLESIGGLMDKTGQKADDAEARGHMMDRVEGWVLKALEDCALLEMQPGLHS